MYLATCLVAESAIGQDHVHSFFAEALRKRPSTDVERGRIIDNYTIIFCSEKKEKRNYNLCYYSFDRDNLKANGLGLLITFRERLMVLK